ncbi:MAG: oxygen-independent coproporphyrinogen III oxidase [Rhodospirillales bacterium]|nr:oxygen-independent coproporphyrinogen III oxidase [Rhodospirillales bacterium]
MSEALAEKYDRAVPRYTSYPTAPHFRPMADDATYRTWLAGLDPAQPLSLYFHIPFCDEMCWFCGCYTKIVNRYEPVRQYLDALEAEIALIADALPGPFRAQHLHWGGGSPTMLEARDWLELTARLRGAFTLTPDAELAVEIDPRDATEEYIAALGEAGVNRASIGVQDFHPDVQTAVNRHQPFAVVERVCGWLRRHGITAINLDLMYGLPHQTVKRVEAMVDLAVRLEPARVALFGYAHVPWMKSHQRLIDEAALPGTAERWRQSAAAGRRLQEHGLVPIGLDHFARPDDPLAVAAAHRRLHRNFQGYTADAAATLLGLGASAIGSLPQGYVQNLMPLKDYREAVFSGRLPVARGLALGDDDRLRAEIIERLMCDLAVDAAAICERHGAEPAVLDPAMAALGPLAADGLIEVEGRRIAVTEAGRPFVRLAAAAFDAYLGTGKARHSRAV